jgi:hypothetical protein
MIGAKLKQRAGNEQPVPPYEPKQMLLMPVALQE